MSGKIILNLADSIDGYISDPDGGFEWLAGDGSHALDTETKLDFESFLQDIDVVVMGHRCYEQGFHKDYGTKDVYVAASHPEKDCENIHFINGDIVETIKQLKSKGKNIYLFGGGVLVDPFIKANAIDEYIIGVIPTILGKGRKLFYENNPQIDLKLEAYSVDNGIVIMKYSKRE